MLGVIIESSNCSIWVMYFSKRWLCVFMKKRRTMKMREQMMSFGLKNRFTCSSGVWLSVRCEGDCLLMMVSMSD